MANVAVWYTPSLSIVFEYNNEVVIIENKIPFVLAKDLIRKQRNPIILHLLKLFLVLV